MVSPLFFKSPAQLVEEAKDKFGSTAGTFFEDALWDPGAPPITRTRSDHGASIWLCPPGAAYGRAVPIGAVYELAQEQTRTIEDVWAVKTNPDALPADTVSQNLTGRLLRLGRYDLWEGVLEEVFGLPASGLLSEAIGSIIIREEWVAPSFLPGGGARHAWEWTGLKFQSLGRQIKADGDRVSRANAAFIWRSRRKMP